MKDYARFWFNFSSIKLFTYHLLNNSPLSHTVNVTFINSLAFMYLWDCFWAWSIGLSESTIEFMYWSFFFLPLLEKSGQEFIENLNTWEIWMSLPVFFGITRSSKTYMCYACVCNFVWFTKSYHRESLYRRYVKIAKAKVPVFIFHYT